MRLSASLPTLCLLLLGSSLSAVGCRHFCPPQTIEARPAEPVPQQASQPPAPPPETETETPPEAPQPTPLERADLAFAQRDYFQAANLYREILRRGTDGPENPHALLRLAIIQLLPSGSLHDEDGAHALLKRLTSHYAASPEAATAEVLLALGDQAQGLRRQLDELKRIDLGTAAPSGAKH